MDNVDGFRFFMAAILRAIFIGGITTGLCFAFPPYTISIALIGGALWGGSLVASVLATEGDNDNWEPNIFSRIEMFLLDCIENGFEFTCSTIAHLLNHEGRQDIKADITKARETRKVDADNRKQDKYQAKYNEIQDKIETLQRDAALYERQSSYDINGKHPKKLDRNSESYKKSLNKLMAKKEKAFDKLQDVINKIQPPYLPRFRSSETEPEMQNENTKVEEDKSPNEGSRTYIKMRMAEPAADRKSVSSTKKQEQNDENETNGLGL